MNMLSTIYDDSYCALLVSILNEVDPDIAIDIIEIGKSKRSVGRRPKARIVAADIAMMIKLKETMTYKQIGAMYGITDKNAYSHMKRYKGSGTSG